MDDQFDNELKKHIRKVFENFEDPSADEGWLQLRKKFPEEEAKRRAFAWMWWAAAAVLFLFLGIGIWMYSKNDQSKNFVAKNQKHAPSENLAAGKKRDTNTKTTSAHTDNPAKTNPGSIAATQPNTPKAPAATNRNTPGGVNPLISSDRSGKNSYIAKTPGGAKHAVNNSAAPQLAATPDINSPAAATAMPKPNAAISNSAGQQLAAIPQTNNSTPATTIPKGNPAVGNSPARQLAATGATNNLTHGTDTIKPKQQAKSINDMFADNQSVKTKKMDANSEKVRFGVYAATYFNYAKGSSNNANLGAGVTAEIKIAKNLKLVTGVTVAQNSLNFNTAVPVSTQSSFAAPSTSNSFSTYSLSGSPKANVLYSPANVASTPSLKNYDANMVGLDIPLNLKYDFNPKKYDVYVLAGLSSGTFINETYTYQYNYPALFSPSLQQIQNQTSRNNFGSFYFAKTLNLAFGVGYPLGKNHLILEPFLKYPLDGLGSQNIRFGAGGINLKFNFQQAKK